MIDVALAALRTGRRLALTYDGHVRIVELHAVGRTAAGRPAVLVWQVRGGSRSGKASGWKLLFADGALAVHLLDEPSDAPRPGYIRDTPQLASFDAQL